MRTSLLLLLLPSLAFAVTSGHHSVYQGGESATVTPTGLGTSYSVAQTEVDFDESPVFDLDISVGESADIYLEGRMWCASTWTEDYLIDQGKYVSNVFGWEIIDHIDGVEDTTFDIEWSPSSESINDYHLLGDLSYQFRMRFEVDGVLSKWYRTSVMVIADPSTDTTAPTVNTDNVFYDFTSLDLEVFPHIKGKFEIVGLVPSDDTFDDIMIRVGFRFAGSWHNTGTYFNSGEQIQYTLNYMDVDSLISARGPAFGVRYEAIDGVGNRTGWVELPDGDMSDHECDWDGTIDIVRNLIVECECSGGVVAVISAQMSTMPCYMNVQMRARSGVGDWVETAYTANATYHFLQAVVLDACDDIDVEYRIKEGEVTTDWESYGSIPCE